MPHTPIPQFDAGQIPNTNDEVNFHADATYVFQHLAGQVIPAMNALGGYIDTALSGINQTVVDTQAAMLAGTTDAYVKGNILGTVSQTGGVPTGAVIQRGSNSNGRYVRYADGTQICWHRAGHSSDNWNIQDGALYRNATAHVWSFPAAFASIPSVSLVGERTANVILGGSLYDVETYRVRYFGTSSVAMGTLVKSMHLTATGHWF